MKSTMGDDEPKSKDLNGVEAGAGPAYYSDGPSQVVSQGEGGVKLGLQQRQ